MSPFFFILAAGIALTTYFFLHYFAYTRVANGLNLSAPRRLGLKVGLALAALSFVLAEAFSRAAWVAPLLYVGSVWLGVLAMAVALFIVEWFLSLVFLERRRAITISALVTLLCLAIYALGNGSRRPVIKDINIPLQNISVELSGLTLVQLSDLHLGALTSLDRLCWIVDRINDISPDLVVITGDLIDRDFRRDKEYCECLRKIKARYGVVAVPGNHDYYAGYDRFLQVASCSNITVLRNEQLVLAGVIQVAGLDEPAGRSFAEGGPNLERTLAGHDPRKPTILLAHRPDGFARAALRRIDLQLSGHTHAGQIPPMDLLIWLTNAYPFGLYENGDSRLYTSCGTGTWGPPMRLFSRNEIVTFRLVRG